MTHILTESTRKDLLMALYCLPGIIIIYVIGLFFFDVIHTSIAAGGAVTAGYGANKKLLHFPFAPMLIAVIGMSITTYLGSLLGHYFIALLLCSMFLAALCALIGLVDQNAWWVVLQWSISFFLAGYYADDASVAIERALLVLGGGLFQSCCIMFLLRKTAFRRNIIEPRNIRIIIHGIHKNIDKKIRFNAAGIYAALAIFICFLLVAFFQIEYSYWATMTVLLILKPDFKNTLARTQNRLLGTLLGILVASGLTLLAPSPEFIVFEIIVSLYLCYALCNQPYAILTTFITVSAVLMFSINGAPELQIAIDRIIATSIGGISAISVMIMRWLYLQYMHSPYKP